MTHDIIGKSLSVFYRENNDSDDLPKVFLYIYEYFINDEAKLKVKDLFGKLNAKEMQEVDNLELAVSFGDYNQIFSFDNPRIVAFYMKSVLKYMQEPLCTYQCYPRFKELCLS